MALIPAILTAVFIIGLLIFLKPSSEVYYLVENKEENELPLDFTIDDDSDEEICNPKEKKRNEESEKNETEDKEKIIKNDDRTLNDDRTINDNCNSSETQPEKNKTFNDNCNSSETTRGKNETEDKEKTIKDDDRTINNDERTINDNCNSRETEKHKTTISCTKETCDIEDDPFSCDTCDDFEVTRTTSSKPIIENTISKKNKKKLEKKMKESLKEGSTV